MLKPFLALAFLVALSGRAAAITPAELTPAEQAKYQLVKSNPAAAAAFLATRDYVHKAADIVANPANKQAAMDLKKPKNFDVKYLLAGDVDKINAAIDIGLDALAESAVA